MPDFVSQLHTIWHPVIWTFTEEVVSFVFDGKSLACVLIKLMQLSFVEHGLDKKNFILGLLSS
jgi:hypothetical protein